MRYSWKIGVVLFICSFSVEAQQSRIDSLKNILPDAADTSRVNILNELGLGIYSSSSTEAETYANEAIALAEKIDYPKGLAIAYRVLGITQHVQSKYVRAIECFNKSMAVAMNLPDASLKASILNNLGMAYYQQSDNKRALEFLLKSLSLAEESGDQKRVAHLYNNIGMIYDEEAQFDIAKKYYSLSHTYALEKNDSALVTKCLNNIAITLKKEHKYDSAIRLHLQGIAIEQRLNNKWGLSSSYVNLAINYKYLKQFDKALEYLNLNYAIKKEMKDTRGIANGLGTIADMQIHLKRYPEAKKNIDEAYALLKSINVKDASLLSRYAEYYEAIGDYKNALKWKERNFALKDSLFNEKKSLQLAELQTLYEVNKREKEIIKLEKEKEEARLVRNIMLISIVSLLILITLITYFLRYRIKKRQEIYQVERELHLKRIENSILREEELKKEIEFKSKELASYTINFVQKSELMEELKRNLQNIDSSDPVIARKINGINKLVENSYQVDREWEDFKMQFENVHHNFFRILKDQCPELTNGDLKLCALLKLNMNMKAAAKVLGISPESVKTARYRLRKKFGLAQDDNLVDFILNIENEMKASEKLAMIA
jgi:tetratricopeptide (TPR) repeat protein